MRILQISSAVHAGGGEKHLIDLSKGLEEKGHDLFFAVRPSCTWSRRLSAARERVLKIPLAGAMDLYSAIRLSKFAREHRINILHAHLARDYPVASLALRRLTESKLVLTRHVLFPMRSVHRRLLSNVSRVIAVSPAVGAQLSGIFDETRIILVSNGIDLERYRGERAAPGPDSFRESYKIPRKAKLIGTLGELKHLKGQEDFILAAHSVSEKFPESFFVSIGKDNSRGGTYRRKLRRLVRVLDLEERFLFLDWLDDASHFQAGLDVFVSPSHTESFGLAILEAMAAGTAIVATRTEGARFLLDGGDTGVIVPVGSPSEIADAVIGLLSDPGKRERLGMRAREVAAERFSLERMVEETEAVYRDAQNEASP